MNQNGYWAKKLGKQDKYWAHEIMTAWCQATGRPQSEAESAFKGKEMSFDRHCLMYLLFKYTIHSTNGIGHLLGDRDHTTILFGIKKIDGLLDAKSKRTTELIAAIEAHFPLQSAHSACKGVVAPVEAVMA